jgi:hypothetical protein
MGDTLFMKKISFLFAGIFAVGSLFTLAACGDDETSNTTMGGTAGGGMGGSAGEGGGTGGMGGTGGGAGGMGGSGGGSAGVCDTYCANITKNCTGENQQYADMASCMGSCGALPEGTAGAMAGNSVQCRIYHAGAAGMDQALHCTHAGPGGGGTMFCGTNCESFCSIATKVCPTQHADNAKCMTECMGVNDMEKYDASDSGGDTLACRLYHLTVASSDAASAATHCAHTVAMNNPVCK